MKVLLFDIETAPAMAHVWSLWKEVGNMTMVQDDWYMLCWCAKWLGEDKIYSSALPDFPSSYKRNKRDDKQILKALHGLLDEADVVIAHNGIKFDRRKVNSRFIINKMKPPSPYKMIDTLLVAKKEFAFMSNRLNDIGKFLHVGGKMTHDGFSLWEGCMDGKKTSWKHMVEYCKHDVKLLEKVYLKLRPYIAQHPNAGVYSDVEKVLCPKCGSDNIHYRGYAYTNVSKFRQYKCNTCGGWGRERINKNTKGKSKNLGTNISC